MTTKAIGETLNKELAKIFADLLRAYMECSDEVQTAIREMVSIVNDPAAEEDEKAMALSTIAEALFPSTHDCEWGAGLADAKS